MAIPLPCLLSNLGLRCPLVNTPQLNSQLNLTASFGTRLSYNHYAWNRRKTQPILLTKTVYRAVAYQQMFYCSARLLLRERV
jgi:hypothetical protein